MGGGGGLNCRNGICRYTDADCGRSALHCLSR